MSSVTHWVDGGLPLMLTVPFTQSGSTLDATIPSDMNLAPAGHYLLFAMVDDIPSKAVLVRLTDSATGDVPPGVNPTRLSGSFRPNPFSSHVELRWYQPSAVRSEIQIHDLSGRRVFQQSSDGDAGWRQLEWDGRVRGQQAAAGVYFVSVDAGGQQWTARLVRLDN